MTTLPPGSRWRAIHIGSEGDDARINGIVIWQRTWRRTGDDAVRLPHPSYPEQHHTYDIYEVGSPDSPVRFAAGELSNGVWGFYMPV